MSAISIITEIVTDTGLVVDLIGKVRANIAKAEDVLRADPDESLAEQIAAAKAKLAAIQADAADADAEFDAALATLKG